MAHIKISDLSTASESYLQERQATELQQVVGGGYAYIGYNSKGYGEEGVIVAGYGNEYFGKGSYIAGDGEGHYQYGSYSYGDAHYY
jgi:hypothetical protein